MVKMYFYTNHLNRQYAFKLIMFMVTSIVFSLPLMADIYPRGMNFSYPLKSLSSIGNPASTSLVIERDNVSLLPRGVFNISASLEYGDLDDVFDKINELADDFQPPDDDPDDGSNYFDWDVLFDKYPDLEGKVSAVKDRVTQTTALLTIIASEGYGKAEADIEGSFILTEELYDGTLLFNFSIQGNSKALGIFEPPLWINERVNEQISTISNFTETDPIQALDLSDDVILFYNPANRKTKLMTSNDSLMLIKSVKMSEFSLSYSYKALTHEYGDLYWGLRSILYRVGLANVNIRLEDISDSEALFDDIRNGDFVYKNGMDFDLGLIFATENYHLGASINNIIGQEFNFPELDRSGLSSEVILEQLNHHKSVSIERQLKLEAAIYSQERHWNLHGEIDVNSTNGSLEDQYQWLTISGEYSVDNWWLSNARFGFSRNLTGTKLSYINVGTTVLEHLNIDIASTLDTVRIDDNELRRGISIRLGVQFDY